MDEFEYLTDEAIDASGAEIGLASVSSMNSIFYGKDAPYVALKKALAAGYETNTGSMQDGDSLRLQSIEPTLKNLTITDLSTVFFNDLLGAKKMAESTVEEYTEVQDIEEAFTFLEGGAPADEDSAYQRSFKLIKYIGKICSITNPIERTKNLIGARAEKIRTGMLAIKRKSNQVAYVGNSTLVTTEYDGVITAVQKGITAGTVQATNQVDLAGKRLTLEVINEGTRNLLNVQGYIQNLRMYVSPNARVGYINELLKDKRYIVGGLRQEVEGLKTNQVYYDGGIAPMKTDLFLNYQHAQQVPWPRRNRLDNAFIATGDTPPATPTLTSVTPGGTGGTIPTAAYDYAVVAVNKFGHRSAPQETNGQNITVTLGEVATIVAADNGSASGREATAFWIYRRPHTATSTAVDAKSYKFLFAVAVGTIIDNGSNMPDTGYAIMVEWDTDQVLAYHQLMDAAIFPLGAVADAPRWLQRLYGALIVYNPKKIIVFKNIGDTSWT